MGRGAASQQNCPIFFWRHFVSNSPHESFASGAGHRLVATLIFLQLYLVPAWEPEYTALTFVTLICAMSLSDAAGIKERMWPIPHSAVLVAGGLFWLLSLVSVMLSEIPFVSWIYFFHFSVLPLSIAFFLVGQHSEARLSRAQKGADMFLAGLGAFVSINISFVLICCCSVAFISLWSIRTDLLQFFRWGCF